MHTDNCNLSALQQLTGQLTKAWFSKSKE